MPGPYVHILVADRLIEHLEKIENWNFSTQSILPNDHKPQDLAAIARQHLNYYSLGAIGPDLFFFFGDFRGTTGNRRTGNTLLNVAHELSKLYNKFDPWISKYEEYLGPFSQNTDEAISRLTGDLSTTITEIMSGLASILISGVEDVLSELYDFWANFSLGLNKGFDNQDFFVSDMLHYRDTSQFAHNLWILAENSGEWSDRLKAYALGYISHVATDVTGHAFVNEKSGGPFRTQWQKHHLTENHMDSQTYDTNHISDTVYPHMSPTHKSIPWDNFNTMFTESALYYRVVFNKDNWDEIKPLPSNYDPQDNSLRGSYIQRRKLDEDSELPDELAQLLFDALEKTYDYSGQANKPTPGRSTPNIINRPLGSPTTDNIKETFFIFYQYLKFSTLDGFKHEKPSTPELFPNLDFPVQTDPGNDDSPGDGEDDDSIWDWALKIVRLILYIISWIIWAATILPGILMDIITIGPRWVAYFIELGIYYILKAERMFMVMTGYFHPMSDEIEISLIQLGKSNRGSFLQVLAEIDHILPWGAPTKDTSQPVPDVNFPHQHDNNSYHHPWDYPETPVELCPTFAGPYSEGAMPEILVEDNTPGKQKIRDLYQAANSPETTDKISFSQVNEQDNLGDPVNFSSYLVWQLARSKDNLPENFKFTDWNMDADRGYGYKCWDWNRDKAETRKDEDGNSFFVPCTAPSQTEKNPEEKNKKIKEYLPNQPLKLHYLDQDDPGCEVNIKCPDPKKRKDDSNKPSKNNNLPRK